jgi:flagellar basal-body rod protein FlgB
MSVTQLPLVEALKTKMRWHQARQTVLAENVANADTPRYRGQDLKAPDFSALVGTATSAAPQLKQISIALTEPGHIAGVDAGGKDGFTSKPQKGDFEVRPNGNAVNLEDEMVKTSENQVDFQAVSSLYQKNLDLIKEAIGKK